MRKLKFVFQIIIAFIVALAAYSGLYQPNAESVRAAVKNNLPQSMQQKQDTGTAQGRLRISVLDVGQADAILLQDGTFIGATHSAELFYVFGTLEVLGGSTLDGKPMQVKKERPQYTLSEQMGRYWVNLVRMGDPNAPGLPAWRPAGNGEYMHFSANDVMSEQTRRPARISFLEKHRPA